MLLKSPPDDAAKLLDAEFFISDLRADLIFLVGRYPEHAGVAVAVRRPRASAADEGGDLGGVLEGEPVHHGLGLDLAVNLCDLSDDAPADELLEAGDVGDEVGVDVVAVECRPKVLVLRRLEQRVELRQLLHGLDELGDLHGERILRRFGGGGGAGEWLGVRRQQREGKGESRGREDGQRFCEDVGRGLGVEQIRVELVAGV